MLCFSGRGREEADVFPINELAQINLASLTLAKLPVELLYIIYKYRQITNHTGGQQIVRPSKPATTRALSPTQGARWSQQYKTLTRKTHLGMSQTRI